MLSQCQEDTSRCKEQVEEMSFEGDEEMEMAIEEGISPWEFGLHRWTIWPWEKDLHKDLVEIR